MVAPAAEGSSCVTFFASARMRASSSMASNVCLSTVEKTFQCHCFYVHHPLELQKNAEVDTRVLMYSMSNYSRLPVVGIVADIVVEVTKSRKFWYPKRVPDS